MSSQKGTPACSRTAGSHPGRAGPPGSAGHRGRQHPGRPGARTGAATAGPDPRWGRARRRPRPGSTV